MVYSLKPFEKPKGEVFIIEKAVYIHIKLINVICVFLKSSARICFEHKYPIAGRKPIETAVSNLHSIREYILIKIVRIIENTNGSTKIL